MYRSCWLMAAVIAMGATPACAQDRDAIEAGHQLYDTHCASCHGLDGGGNTPIGKSMKIRVLGSPEVQKQADAKLNEIISKGKNKMPSFSSKLNAEEIKGLVAHVRTLAKK